MAWLALSLTVEECPVQGQKMMIEYKIFQFGASCSRWRRLRTLVGVSPLIPFTYELHSTDQHLPQTFVWEYSLISKCMIGLKSSMPLVKDTGHDILNCRIILTLTQITGQRSGTEAPHSAINRTN